MADIAVCNVLDLSRFDENSFDVVLCMGAMYHMPSDDEKLRAIRECARAWLIQAQDANDRLHDRIDTMRQENKQLIETVKDYRWLLGALGEEKTDNILAVVKAKEQARKRLVRSRGYGGR